MIPLRYALLAAAVVVGTTSTAVAITRHLCRITPEAGARLMDYIHEQLG